MTIDCKSLSYLEFLDKYGLIETLECINIEFSELSNLPNLKKLKIWNSPNLITINNLPNLIELDCSGSNITTINNLPNLVTLTASFCINLKNLGNLPILEKLDCNFSTNLEFFPDSLYNLKSLNCDYTLINSLPTNLPNLKYLSCDSCPNLRYIPIYNNLKTLNISSSGIIEIPNLDNLKYLYTMLTNIDFIPCLPNLRVLNCENTLVRSITNLPNLTVLNCRGCKMLDTLDNLANLNSLYCQGSSITRLPIFTKLGILEYSGEKVDKYTIPINLLHKISYEVLLECLEYNSYNINYIFKHSEHINNLLTNNIEFVMLANDDIQEVLIEMANSLGIKLPFLIKSAVKV
jgi:Leucine-rich repeat (LRR) protein